MKPFSTSQSAGNCGHSSLSVLPVKMVTGWFFFILFHPFHPDTNTISESTTDDTIVSLKARFYAKYTKSELRTIACVVDVLTITQTPDV